MEVTAPVLGGETTAGAEGISLECRNSASGWPPAPARCTGRAAQVPGRVSRDPEMDFAWFQDLANSMPKPAAATAFQARGTRRARNMGEEKDAGVLRFVVYELDNIECLANAFGTGSFLQGVDGAGPVGS